MPFRQPYDSYYPAIFTPALQAAGYVVTRADDLFTPRPIMLDIQECILEADLILCDMSERNPNVFYELGLAHAIGKPAILVSRKQEDIPFDLRHIRAITYDYTVAGWEEILRKAITAAAQAVTESSQLWPPPLVGPQGRPSRTDPGTESCPLVVALSRTKESFYFHSVGVKRDLIATIFVLWVELVNRSESPLTVMEALWLVGDRTLSNTAKPAQNMPYGNVTYVRLNVENQGGQYLEFSPDYGSFAFRPHIHDINLALAGGTSRSGSLIFWLIPPDTSLSGTVECKLVIRTSRGDTELPVKIEQEGV
jgi:hypothetical protein